MSAPNPLQTESADFRARLQALLLAREAASPAQLAAADRALDEQGGLWSTRLVQQGVPLGVVLALVAELSGLPLVSRARLRAVNAEPFKALKPDAWRLIRAAPFGLESGKLLVAFANPSVLHHPVAQRLPPHLPHVAAEEDVQRTLELLFPPAPAPAPAAAAPADLDRPEQAVGESGPSAAGRERWESVRAFWDGGGRRLAPYVAGVALLGLLIHGVGRFIRRSQQEVDAAGQGIADGMQAAAQEHVKWKLKDVRREHANVTQAAFLGGVGARDARREKERRAADLAEGQRLLAQAERTFSAGGPPAQALYEQLANRFELPDALRAHATVRLGQLDARAGRREAALERYWDVLAHYASERQAVAQAHLARAQLWERAGARADAVLEYGAAARVARPNSPVHQEANRRLSALKAGPR